MSKIFSVILVILGIVGLTAAILGTLVFISSKIYPQLQIIIPYKILMTKSIKNASKIKTTDYFINNSVAPQTGKTYSAYGISYTTNWNEKKHLVSDISDTTIFDNNNVIMILSPKANVDLYSFLSNAKAKGNEDGISEVYKELNITNNKSMFNVMANLTNEDLNLNTSLNKARVYLYLLLIKNALMGDTQKILTFELNGSIFYIYNNINSTSKNKATEIVFFDTTGTQHGVSIIGDTSQSSIDSLIKTLRVE